MLMKDEKFMRLYMQKENEEFLKIIIVEYFDKAIRLIFEINDKCIYIDTDNNNFMCSMALNINKKDAKRLYDMLKIEFEDKQNAIKKG
jgi:hypothetical protein